MNIITKLSLPSIILTILAWVGAYYADAFFRNILLSVGEVMAGLAVALFVVNGFLNQEERKKAAIVLLKMVHRDISAYHNSFIEKGRDKFGIPVWNAIIDAMNSNQRNPEALTPDQRKQVLAIIDENADRLAVITKSIDERFREVTYVLGWNFHPKIMRDCMETRMEIDKFRILAAASQLDAEQQSKKIELYFDLDADTSAVLTSLAKMCGIKIAEEG